MQPKINTKPYEKIIKEVIIDSHEQDRKDYALKQYKNFNPRIDSLNIGDYLFEGYNNITVCVEYKTGNDFLTSIDTTENHLHNQTFRMINEYDYHLIMVEVEDLQKLITKRFYQTGLRKSVQEINGAVSELNTVSTVVFSQSRFGAFDSMMRHAGKLINDKPFLWKFGRKKHNSALNYLSSIHGLNDKASDIVDTLNLYTLDDLLSLSVDDLMRVDGIGKVKAEHILSEIK